jgi:hypothetical protein
MIVFHAPASFYFFLVLEKLFSHTQRLRLLYLSPPLS